MPIQIPARNFTFSASALPAILSMALAVVVSSCASCGRYQSTTQKVAGHTMVEIPGREYYMGKTEVTQAQWEAVMGNNPSTFKDPNNPVEQVSWNDCQEFLEKFNALPEVKKSGLVFRLPTEEEWEYACRVGATGDYSKLADGTEITEGTLGRVAWFDDNSDETTHRVGQKEPNAFGLYDMHGNVWEWTQTADGEDCVYRGGSWNNSAWYCESSCRGKVSPDSQYDFLSFRLCASPKG